MRRYGRVAYLTTIENHLSPLPNDTMFWEKTPATAWVKNDAQKDKNVRPTWVEKMNLSSYPQEIIAE